MLIDKLIEKIENSTPRSAWKKGVKQYALDLLEELKERGWTDTSFKKEDALNGADDWKQYSYGGCSLIYDCEIAERLCTKTELKRTREGEKDPNPKETWLDVQARALWQAWTLIHLNK